MIGNNGERNVSTSAVGLEVRRERNRSMGEEDNTRGKLNRKAWGIDGVVREMMKSKSETAVQWYGSMEKRPGAR